MNYTLEKIGGENPLRKFPSVSRSIVLQAERDTNYLSYYTLNELTPGSYQVTMNLSDDIYSCPIIDMFNILPAPECRINVRTCPSACVSSTGTKGGRAIVYEDLGPNDSVKWFKSNPNLPLNSWVRRRDLRGLDNILYKGTYQVRLIKNYGDYKDSCNAIFEIDTLALPKDAFIRASGNCKVTAKIVLPPLLTVGSLKVVWRYFPRGASYASNVLRIDSTIVSRRVGDTMSADLNYHASLDSGSLGLEISNYFEEISCKRGTGCLFVRNNLLNLNQVRTGRTYALCITWGEPLNLTDVTKPVKDTTYSAPMIARAGQASFTLRQKAQSCQSNTLLRNLYRVKDFLNDPDNFLDTMNITYNQKTGYTTLYYYDRAGNLIQSVPPKGVALRTINPTSRNETPDNPLATTYEYSSIGQKISETSPDAGTSSFIYNQFGQLRASRTANQVADHTFSYLKYDSKGRLVESGLGDDDGNLNFANPMDTLNEDYFIGDTINQNIDFKYPTHTLSKEKTKTYYDQALILGTTLLRNSYTNETQQELNNRISYTTYSNNDVDNELVTTAYSYDRHGNVKWICQIVPGLEPKFINYTYDLVSSKVTMMRYNPGFKDQYFLKY